MDERGQARLPDRELIRVDVWILVREAFNVKAIEQLQSLGVGKVVNCTLD